MSAYPSRKIIRALEKKGFVRDNTHHMMFWLVIEGRRRGIRTLCQSRHTGIRGQVASSVAKEMKLRRSELDSFVQCPLQREDYLDLLREKGEIR